MKEFRLGNILIGGNNVPLVIPEIGINHNGSLDVAKQMVLAAYRAGAKIIKHQTHIVEDEMSAVAREVIPGNATISIYEIMEKCALSETEELELKLYTESLGMLFLSTPFSRAAADRLEKFNVVGYKIGSGEMNNYPLIKHIAEFGKPMIISTGMNTMKSIIKLVDILENYNVPYALMHTTNLYPTKPSQVRLGAMQEMMNNFPDIPIGLSDHTTNNNSCIAAMTLGAKLVERHFTDTFDRKGPDIICSMDEYALKDLLVAAEEISQMIGGRKEPVKEEQVTIDFAFATVVTIADVKKGEEFNKSNLWVKRPGIGEIHADKYEKILGCVANCDILKDTHLKCEMIRDYEK